MSRDVLLGVDIGTTIVRAFAFTYDGKIVADSKKEVKIEHPKPSWAEEEPDELFNSTIKVIREVTKIVGKRIKAIGFSGQMHGLCCVDKDGKPLTRLIPWVDVRASEQVKVLEEKIGAKELYKRTGCPPLFIYVAPKVLWVKENLPDVFARCRKILTAQDYVVFKLFRDYYTNPSLSAGSQLLNINEVKWDSKILTALELDESMLPNLVEGDIVFDKLPKNAAELLGLNEGIPVALGASDGALSNVGLGAVKEGIGAMSLGSSGAVRVISKHPIWDNEMRFFCYYIASRNWLPGGAVNNCGIVLRWFRDNFAEKEIEEAKKRGVDVYKLLDEQAAKVGAGCNGLLFLPFMSGERFPIRDPYVRAMLFGLSLAHGKPHIIRCMMEGITFTLRWIQEAIEEHAKVNAIKISGGGAKSSLWRQIVSDVFGKKVIRTEVEEASALGAAMLAGIAIGDFSNMEKAANEMVKDVEVHEPSYTTHEQYSRLFEIYKRIYKNCRGYCEELLSLNKILQ
jgi:gluconokinase